MFQMTNDSRADRALNAVETDCDNNDLQTKIADLLANLQHLCRREEIDFEECLESGRMHFEAELKDEGEDRADAPLADDNAAYWLGYCPGFRDEITALADKNGLTREEVVIMWRAYVKTCEGFDQSPVMFEFIQWNAAKFEKGGK
jgi:hypothetical protein